MISPVSDFDDKKGEFTMAAASTASIPSSQPTVGSHRQTALEDDAEFNKWNESCAEIPTWMSLERRMVQVGTLVGLDGRRLIWSFLTRSVLKTLSNLP
jgi:hypothetical protein